MYVNKKYFTKYIYVCLGRKIPWICMYTAKYLTKHIYVCLGSKIPWICVYIAKIPHKNSAKNNNPNYQNKNCQLNCQQPSLIQSLM